MTSDAPFVNNWTVRGDHAKAWAEAGLLVFGPGPRTWTWCDPSGRGAQYRVLGHQEGEHGGYWRLQKAREW